MKIVRVPTNIIIKELMPHRNVKHLFGRYFWDADFKKILKGDKPLSHFNV